MTPIPPEKRALYPADWRGIRAEILLRAGAGDPTSAPRCECMGECGNHRPVPICECGHTRDEHLDQGACRSCPDQPGRRCGAFVYTHAKPRRCVELHGESGRFMSGRVILTVAHLWRGPCAEHDAKGEKCGDPSHLKAMCQRCHLAYDAPQHSRHRAEAWRARKNIVEMEFPRDGEECST